jgi:peroxiredoxin (alkyl hydroperoxide reductase subunit C)
MMADGSGEFTKNLGLELDLVARGLGVRSQRYLMILDNGVVKHLAVEAAGKFEVSDAASAIKAL